jgi:hypothetical protein
MIEFIDPITVAEGLLGEAKNLLVSGATRNKRDLGALGFQPATASQVAIIRVDSR